MSDSFDPYHRWRGIPPEKQPPNHYVLLAIKPLEDNLDVIESAADQRMAHLRTFQTGEHGDLSQKLLNEVAAAKICLLDPRKKAAYDRNLREKIAATKAVVPEAEPMTPATTGQAVRIETADESSVASVGRRRRSQLGPIVVAVAIVAVVVLLVWGINASRQPGEHGMDMTRQREDREGSVAPARKPAESSPSENVPPPRETHQNEAKGTPSATEPDPVAGRPAQTDPESSAASNNREPSGPSSPQLGEVALTFDLSVAGTIADKNGRGTGFTHRLPGTGGSLPANDPNMDLLSKPGHLLLRSTFGGVKNRPTLETPGVLLEGVGTKDLVISALLRGIDVSRGGNFISLYAGVNENKYVSAGAHSRAVFAVFENRDHGGGLASHSAGGQDVQWFSAGDDILLRFARTDGVWQFSWNNLTTPAKSGSCPPLRMPWLDAESDLYIGVYTATPNPRDSTFVSTIDSFSVDFPGASSQPTGTPRGDDTAPSQTDPEQPLPEVQLPRQPLPSATAQAAVTGQIEEVYGIAGAKTSAQKLQLAAKMFDLAEQVQDNPAEKFVLLRKAMELAGSGGDASLMLQAVDAIGADFEIDVLKVKQKVLLNFAKTATSADRIGSLAENSLTLVDQALAVDRPDIAFAIIDTTYNACSRAAGHDYRKQVYDRRVEVQKVYQAWQQFQDALTKLKADPEDAAANLTAGRWYCLKQVDWEQGLPFLAKCSDDVLKTAAEKELDSPPTEPLAQIELADVWWDAAQAANAETKPALLHHAGTWYEKAQPDVTSVVIKDKLAQRLDAIAEIGYTAPGYQSGKAETSGLTPRSPKPSFPNGTVAAFTFEKDTFFNRNGKTYVRDVSGSRGFGLVSGARPVPGQRGQALLFDGDDLVGFPDSRLPSGNSPRTISFWMQTSDTVSCKICFSYGQTPSNNATYTVIFETPDSQGRGNKMAVGNAGGRDEPAGSTLVTDGKWHHVALVYDGNNEAILYIDGKIDLRFTKSYQTSLTGTAFIGAYVDGGPSFKGSIDDFLIIARALSTNEIKELYSLPSSSDPSKAGK